MIDPSKKPDSSFTPTPKEEKQPKEENALTSLFHNVIKKVESWKKDDPIEKPVKVAPKDPSEESESESSFDIHDDLEEANLKPELVINTDKIKDKKIEMLKGEIKNLEAELKNLEGSSEDMVGLFKKALKLDKSEDIDKIKEELNILKAELYQLENEESV